MVFNFKHANAHEHDINIALKKYAVESAFPGCAMGKNGELGALY
jgi:hypothetical protein